MTRIKIILDLETIQSENIMVPTYYTVGKLMMRIKEKFYNQTNSTLKLKESDALFLFFKTGSEPKDLATIQPLTKTLGEVYYDLGGPENMYVYVKREHTFG
jgi:hypothetical protein